MTAPETNTAAKPSASGATAATTVPNAASRMSRISGKPIVSPRASCRFDTCWKFDQIAGSPSTRVCTAGARLHERVPELRRLVDRVGRGADEVDRQERRPSAGEQHGRAGAEPRRPAQRRLDRGEPRLHSLRARAGDEERERRRRDAGERVDQLRHADRGAAGNLPAAAAEVVGLVHREPRAACEEHEPDGDHRPAATRDGSREPGEPGLDPRPLRGGHAPSVPPASTAAIRVDSARRMEATEPRAPEDSAAGAFRIFREE